MRNRFTLTNKTTQQYIGKTDTDVLQSVAYNNQFVIQAIIQYKEVNIKWSLFDMQNNYKYSGTTVGQWHSSPETRFNTENRNHFPDQLHQPAPCMVETNAGLAYGW